MQTSDIRRVSVVGLGYIGLPTAAMFASRKVQVIGIDVKPDTVDTINRGEVHIVEPDLDIAVRSSTRSGYLRASLTPEPAEAFLIAVPTPFVGDSHEPDLSYIQSACETIAPALVTGNIVILESTSPVGATEHMADWLAELRPDLSFPQKAGENSDIRIAHCPERVLPGHVMQELITNDRVIGGMTERCSEMAVAVYRHFVTGNCVVTTPRTAEMAKLTENSFRDVNIAFANELSLICDKLDINVWELINLANLHPRVNILRPGPGVGGHCIAVDPWFIVAKTPEEAQIIHTARKVNDGKPQWVIDKVVEAVQARGQSTATVACLGVAFKPDIDDLRESPALAIAKKLIATENLNIIVAEPNIDKLPANMAELDVSLHSPEQAIAKADIVLGLVAHREFKALSRDLLDGKTVIDTCAIWE
ncbi:UDP-N-acetyl-D-mannosaminuronic acid dehydrogenase [Sagittula marina]|uniref:UDP-N-acetyl-D-mannosaminuronic acid dehydrogenase n=1 Tax=Sagittula marina TaxID=943940 RepID=A0A7W6DXJ5_9RHOB|nr:UDP-N-acetyl-D-mannosamine dehydrogenase [Sagittula marina]MBB3988455.1 UDP-N-acetyl-D-mannosaminuronic acid dehydrogenase [Sagittula marina]